MVMDVGQMPYLKSLNSTNLQFFLKTFVEDSIPSTGFGFRWRHTYTCRTLEESGIRNNRHVWTDVPSVDVRN
jgi:hypothetical protein